MSIKPWPYNNNRSTSSALDDMVNSLRPEPELENLPYVRGSETSKQAADEMKAHAPSVIKRVFEFIKMHGSYGATDDEIEVALDLKHQTASARRRDLEKMGIIEKRREPCGTEYSVRKTRSGRNAGVYIHIDGATLSRKRGRPKKSSLDKRMKQAACLLTKEQWADLCWIAAEQNVGTGPMLRTAWLEYVKTYKP